MNKARITQNTIMAYYYCPRKAYNFIFTNTKSITKYYTSYLAERKKETEKLFFRSQKKSPSLYSGHFDGKSEIIANANFKKGQYSAKRIYLIKVNQKSRFGNYSYEPLIFSTSLTINTSDRIYAAYIGYILSQVKRITVKKATIICLDGRKRSIKLNSDKHLLISNVLTKWCVSKPESPPVIINKHCPLCGFEKNCLVEAKKLDSIGLLGRMTLKVLKKYHSKGIFSINQLSYVYKPRRRSRFWENSTPRHRYELQALAIRTKKIYTCEVICPPTSNLEIFIDIESFPEHSFHYLIGILISVDNYQHYEPLWANNITDEKEIWQKFLMITRNYPNAPIFHYGNYDRKIIQILAKRHNTSINRLLNRMHNINSYIFGRIYFPTLTNKLKEICNYFGFHWKLPDSNGLNSIVWRYEFSENEKFNRKNDIITYNEEDCFYLKKIKDIVQKIYHDSDRLDIKNPIEQRQKLSLINEQIVKDLTVIIESAHGKYEQLKISKKIKSKSNIMSDNNKAKRGRKRIIPKSKIDKVVCVPRGRICPNHKRPLKESSQIAEKIIIDIVSTPKGLKRRITKYIGGKGRCPNCSDRYLPPSIRRMGRGTLYGHGLKAWVAYQRLAMMLPYRKISQLMEDSFNLWIGNGSVNSLFNSFSSYYTKTEKSLLDTLLKSPILHVDETQVNIKGRIQYIWVFTNGKHVIFRLTSKRDSSIVHKMLKNYEGVLISDFFSGYDGVKCLQQKCWVHLIRDINKDFQKSPFDVEFEKFVFELRNMLLPLFEAIEKYGLKKRNLNKFKKPIEVFYKRNIIGTIYESEVTKKYQKRFKRYRKSLFVFLEYDGIPWNNNMAERALRHIAVQRKISGSFSVAGMIGYLRMLGIMQSCRFQNKPLLKFLMSGEQNIDLFRGMKNIKGWLMT